MNRENLPNPENPQNLPDSPNPPRSPKFLFNDYGRVRSGWRFIIFQLSIVLVGSAFGAGIFFLLKQLQVFYNAESLLSFVVPNVIIFVPAIVCGWLCGKVLENLPFRAIGLWFTKNWFKDLIFGLLIGAASIIFAVLTAILLGGMRLELNRSAGSSAIGLTLLASFVVFVIGALAEEAYFRGYILQTFARAHLAWLAIGLTSLFFAAGHLGNKNADWVSTTNTALAGIWFGVAYLKTRNLWFPFGIHLTWNWVQGAVFGIPVSGITSLTTAPYLQQVQRGEKFITGGDYGIEGGLACTIAIIASGALIWFAPFIKPSEEMLTLTDKEAES